jgi:hypothetical protein
MILVAARSTHSTNGVDLFALKSSRKKAIARITVHAIANPYTKTTSPRPIRDPVLT